jgi:hypothetical protein
LCNWLLFQAVEVGFGAEVEGFFADGGGGQGACLEEVVGEEFELSGGGADNGAAAFAEEVEAVVGVDG